MQTLSNPFRRSGGPTVTQIWIPRQMGHGYNGGICEKFLFFRFRRGFSCKWWRWGEIDFETLDIESSNENDESKINEKDEETVTLDDPITNETKEVPVVIIDWFMILEAIKKSKNDYSQI